MSYTICSRFKGEHIVYAGYTICTSREHFVYGAFCGSTSAHFISVRIKELVTLLIVLLLVGSRPVNGFPRPPLMS